MISELKEEKEFLQANGVDEEVQKIEADIAKLNTYIKNLEFTAAPTGTRHEDLYRKSNASEKNNALAIFTRSEDWMSGMENTPQVLRNLIAYTTNVPITDHKVRIQKPTKEQLEALGSTGAPNMLYRLSAEGSFRGVVCDVPTPLGDLAPSPLLDCILSLVPRILSNSSIDIFSSILS